jgi:anthranilate synthase/aminodeoxychorismate synthase-like glutamine amidotransferase
MWILIDNYDSFTHILRHYLLRTGAEVEVVYNDELEVRDVLAMKPERIIISPGPGTPKQAGITLPLIEACFRSIPILGICLGHQALGMHFGGQLVHAQVPMHGKTSLLQLIERHPIFDGIDERKPVMRYHSLVIQDLQSTGLQTMAVSRDTRDIMAIRHVQHPCIGLQFHPESIGTEEGWNMLSNWSNIKF